MTNWNVCALPKRCGFNAWSKGDYASNGIAPFV